MDATLATIAREPLSYSGSGGVRPASLNRETYASLMGVIERKDNTWLQLDVCPSWRETGRCTEAELCCHAHPPPHIAILESNRVVACYDDVKKGACRRKDCKFFHPPNHLKNVVNTNGRNNLRLRNELKQQFKVMGQSSQATLTHQAYYTQEVPTYPTPLYYPSLPYSPAFAPVQCAARPTAHQVAAMQRVDSPPRPPGELPDWQIPQECVSEGGGKTPPRGQAHAQSPALKFHPYMMGGGTPGARKAAMRKDMIGPAMMQAALGQPEMVHYYPQYSTPYLVPQQMMYIDPTTFAIPPISSRSPHD